MSKLQTRSVLEWSDPPRVDGEKEIERRKGFFALSLFRIFVSLCAGAIVCFGWYFEDRPRAFRVGEPSPRTYIAQMSSTFVDSAATEDLRSAASDSVANVRVRDADATKIVSERIIALRGEGSIAYAPSELAKIVEALPDASRARVLAVTAEIAADNFDRSASELEQTSVLWSALEKVEMDQSEKNIVFQLLNAMLVPTISEDSEMTDLLRREIAAGVPDVVRERSPNDVIVSVGEIITEEIAAQLILEGYRDASIPWKTLAFVAASVFAWTLWITWLGIVPKSNVMPKEWIFITVVLLIDWILQRISISIGIDLLPSLLLAGWAYLTLPPSFAFHLVMGGAFFGYLIASPTMVGVLASGCVISVITAGLAHRFVRGASSRMMIWRGIFDLGVCVSIISSLTRWGLGLIVSWQSFGFDLVLSAFWSSFAIAILPIWESIFGMLSPLKLIELTLPSQKLLKRLQSEASGTYYHTMQVSLLAEVAAEKLGLNSLLVKAGSLYHDIGKLKSPFLYTENQAGYNPHDRYAPQKSSELIISHVSNGLQLADEEKLPERIKDFIREHHGRSTQMYFYNKAQKAAEKEGEGAAMPDKANFRYPGPNPRSPETAVLMVADSVEAAMRGAKGSLESVEQYEEFIGRVIKTKLDEGMLDRVDLSFSDISVIKKVFTETIYYMYHIRDIKAAPGQAQLPAHTGDADR